MWNTWEMGGPCTALGRTLADDTWLEAYACSANGALLHRAPLEHEPCVVSLFCETVEDPLYYARFPSFAEAKAQLDALTDIAAIMELLHSVQKMGKHHAYPRM